MTTPQDHKHAAVETADCVLFACAAPGIATKEELVIHMDAEIMEQADLEAELTKVRISNVP